MNASSSDPSASLSRAGMPHADAPIHADAVAHPTRLPADDPSIAIPLGPRAWIVVTLVTLVVLTILPRANEWREPFRPSDHWRQPTEAAEDYWQFRQFERQVVRDGAIPVLGDSAIWGLYAKPSETLSAELSRRLDGRPVANLGVQGLSPLTLEGLQSLAPCDSPPLLLFNPIWMTSPRRDLAAIAETSDLARLNHVTLLPQWFDLPPAYAPTLEERLSRSADRTLTIRQFSQHLRIDDLGGRDLPSWLREHPRALPWQGFDDRVLAPTDEPGEPVRRRVPSGRETTYDWMEPEKSNQYRAFVRTAQRLSDRGSLPFVVVARLDPTGRSERCLEQERKIGERLRSELAARGIPSLRLESGVDKMADASHPTPDGYRSWADELIASTEFGRWLASRSSSPSLRSPRL